MLFNSIEFLFFFLPVTLGIFIFLKHLGLGRAAIGFLGLASLFFYGWWDIRYLALLLGSVTFNYLIGLQLTRSGAHKIWLSLGIILNLSCLGFFKYFDFFIGNINSLFSQNIEFWQIILPLGISFFTFQQIAYLVDAYKGKAEEHRFIDYLVFVTFFPQLIAGPIVHHKNMMPQFKNHAQKSYDWTLASMGLSLFAIGLFKKVILADEFASHSTPLFSAVNGGEILTFAQSWSAALSYTFQLYFDFSGYCDMAIGLGLMFGVKLPANFLSPYKSTNIIAFWRKWHITLSQFLKDYLYIPLGGNRKGALRRYTNLLITMILGGLWHGAGWTFVIWGGLHGLYLVINHAWQGLFPPSQKPKITRKIFGWVITMLAIIVAWVVFRSASISDAVTIIQSMFGFNGFSSQSIEQGAKTLQNYDITASFKFIILGAFIVLVFQNSMELIENKKTSSKIHQITAWSLCKKWMAYTMILLLTSLYFIVYNANRISEFIYFQF